jgi:hypothetical protein
MPLAPGSAPRRQGSETNDTLKAVRIAFNIPGPLPQIKGYHHHRAEVGSTPRRMGLRTETGPTWRTDATHGHRLRQSRASAHSFLKLFGAPKVVRTTLGARRRIFSCTRWNARAPRCRRGRAVAGDGKPVAAFRAVVGARRYRRDLGRRRRRNRCWFRCKWWGGAAGAVLCSGAAGAFTCSAYRVADSQHRQDHQQSERRETLAPPPRAALRHSGVSRGRALSWRRTRTSVDSACAIVQRCLFREHPRNRPAKKKFPAGPGEATENHFTFASGGWGYWRRGYRISPFGGRATALLA